MGEYTDEHAKAGIKAALPAIETWPNQYPDYEITVEIPEYNAICPKTGLPDFGHLTIRYVPGRAVPGAQVAEALHRGVPEPRHLLRERREPDPGRLCRRLQAEEDGGEGSVLLARRNLLRRRSEISEGPCHPRSGQRRTDLPVVPPKRGESRSLRFAQDDTGEATGQAALRIRMNSRWSSCFKVWAIFPGLPSPILFPSTCTMG